MEMAQQQSDVPKFGNCESEENVPDRGDSDEARKGRSGGKINPNDPRESSDLLSVDSASAKDSAPGEKAQQEESIGRGGGDVGQVHEHQKGKGDGDFKQFTNSPARDDSMNSKAGNESVSQRHGVRGSTELHKRSTRPSAGSDNSLERSPLHLRTAGRGTGAPPSAWEGKNSYESSYSTPGRSRLRPKGDESPDEGAAVPKFGDWDESNPAAADGYTQQFNKVREERQLGAGRIPGSLPTGSPYGNVRKQTPVDSSWGCCFFWSRK